MKQLMQDLDKGATFFVDAPAPQPSPKSVIIKSTCSLISAGTERMLVEFGKASYLDKARQQPERVRDVLNKARTDGLASTYEAVRAKLDQPLPMGYSNVGVISSVGADTEGFLVGDRVVSNGAHAQTVKVPMNLCAKIPDNVSDTQASFTVVSSIALQGIRLMEPTLGESVVVIGTGLIGLLAIQLLVANGCRVLAVDMDAEKLALANRYGAEICNPKDGEDPLKVADSWSRGMGVDGVIVAAATPSNEPIKQAANMCRKRGRVVLVGVVGLELNRADFYEKEITFQVSCSYGPGRYDPSYEAQGHDYPLGFVRWTEQRNFQAVLDLMASGALNVDDLITEKYMFEDAPSAYDLLLSGRSVLGLLLQYEDKPEVEFSTTLAVAADVFEIKHETVGGTVAVIGAGNHSARTLMPALREAGVRLHSIVSHAGLSGAIVGKKYGFEYVSTDIDTVLSNDEVDSVVIATQHDSHADLVCRSLLAKNNVFVEKPLALTLEQLKSVANAHEVSGKTLMVGFNRRFSPLISPIKQSLQKSTQPKSFVFTMNAGFIPPESWVHDRLKGGGRILGEACHYIDLMRHLAGAPIASWYATAMPSYLNTNPSDTAVIILKFTDGSAGTINYFANGDNSFPKERIEVFCDGCVHVVNNFRTLKTYGRQSLSRRLWSQNKGQKACVDEFFKSVCSGGAAPIPPSEIFEVSRVSIEIADHLDRA